jgi:hypothetical protein
MLPVNSEAVFYNAVTYDPERYSVWAEQTDGERFDLRGAAVENTVRIFVSGEPPFGPGCFVTLGGAAYPLTADTLEDFLTNAPHYIISKSEKLITPDGNVHHVEFTALGCNIYDKFQRNQA